MTVFDGEALGKEAVHLLYHHVNWSLGPRMYRLWRPALLSREILENYRSAPLYCDILFLARIANGEFERSTASEEFLAETLAALQQVWEDLRRPPFGPMYGSRMHEFELPPLMLMLTYVQYWVLNEDLITLSAAAELFTGRPADQAGLMVIHRLITRWEQGKEGGLRVIIDPSEPNPQHSKRVCRSDVERLREEQEQSRREKASK